MSTGVTYHRYKIYLDCERHRRSTMDEGSSKTLSEKLGLEDEYLDSMDKDERD